MTSSRWPAERTEAALLGAGKLAATLAQLAVRRGSSAAWVGLDWLGDSEVSQLVVLGPDLYNGACGIAVFLAAHAALTGDVSSDALARAAVAGLRSSRWAATRRGRLITGCRRGLGLGESSTDWP